MIGQIPAVIPTYERTHSPRQGAGTRRPSPADWAGALWAALYRLAISLGWTWDPEGGRWLDAEGEAVG